MIIQTIKGTYSGVSSDDEIPIRFEILFGFGLIAITSKAQYRTRQKYKKQRMQCYCSFTVLKFFFICGLPWLTYGVPSP
jgi:hypothetical protein